MILKIKDLSLSEFKHIKSSLSFAQKSQETKDTSISNLKKKISKLSKVKDLN